MKFIISLSLMVLSITTNGLLMKMGSHHGIAQNFYRMVDRFQTYSNQDIALLESERLKHLVFGGREALTEPKVVKSFAILYEDVLPVRFGGDILFNLLDRAINNAEKNNANIPLSIFTKSNKQEPLSGTSRRMIRSLLKYALEEEEADMDLLSLENCCDNLFTGIDRNNDGKLSLEEFESWVRSVPVTALEEESDKNTCTTSTELDPTTLFQEIDVNSDGTLSVEEFRLWTTGCLVDPEECVVDLEAMTTNTLEDIPVSAKGRKYRERYLNMVRSFANWGELLYQGENSVLLNSEGDDQGGNRLGQVIDGCFAGAKNTGVVKALGILYEDYLPLRLAGDTVFKLVKGRVEALISK